MSLEDLGNIGEFVAAVAVIVTLAYLAVQIRQNTLSLRAAASQEVVRSANEFSSLLVRDAGLNGLYSKGISDYSSLSTEQLGQFSHLLYMGLRNYWVAKRLTSEGLVSENICEAYEAAFRSIFESPKMLDWLGESEQYLTSDLREQVRKLVAAPQTARIDRP